MREKEKYRDMKGYLLRVIPDNIYDDPKRRSHRDALSNDSMFCRSVNTYLHFSYEAYSRTCMTPSVVTSHNVPKKSKPGRGGYTHQKMPVQRAQLS